mmetsp:Transcript_37120/g.83430  ORF Transcript_37120/g.83430 Transcript_37120/m.83430 type:complete len:125 (-) Transcript_37120:746-1120(-)
MDAPESPEVQDDAIDAAMAGRFDTWVKDEVRIEALREAAEGRHRGSWVHQRVMAEMPSFGSITELDDFFRSMSVDANDANGMVECPTMSLTRRATTTSTSTESIRAMQYQTDRKSTRVLLPLAC